MPDDALPDRDLPNIPFGLVLTVCAEIQAYTDDRIRHWHQLVHAADLVRPMIGISPSAWDEAKTAMGLQRGWAVSIEYTDEPHPRNICWEIWGHPMFDLKDAKGVMMELDDCRKAQDGAYIHMNPFDNQRGWETVMMSFIVNRPKTEPSFRSWRQEVDWRAIRYTHEMVG